MRPMHAYSLGYHDYESKEVTVLLHDCLFTEEEWQSMLVAAFVQAARLTVEADNSRSQEAHESNLEYAQALLDEGNVLGYANCLADLEYPRRSYLTVSSLLRQSDMSVVTILVERYGFQRLEYAFETSIWDHHDLSVAIRKDSETEDTLIHKIVDSVREFAASNEDYFWENPKAIERRNQILTEMGYDEAAQQELIEKSYLPPPVDEELLRAFGCFEDSASEQETKQ